MQLRWAYILAPLLLLVIFFQNCGQGFEAVNVEELAESSTSPGLTEDDTSTIVDPPSDDIESLPEEVVTPEPVKVIPAPAPSNPKKYVTLLNQDFESLPIGSIWQNKTQAVVTADPTGQRDGNVLKVFGPKGKGPGLTKKLHLSRESESACFDYDVYFAKFDTAKSTTSKKKIGKLPGLAGGDTPTGGSSVEGRKSLNGFSNRFHFVEDQKINQYQYFPGKIQDYGRHTAVGKFKIGQWHSYRSCINLGKVGAGEDSLQTWIDGVTRGTNGGVKPSVDRFKQWRVKSSVKINSVLFNMTFTHEKPETDIIVYFDNLRVIELDESQWGNL